MLVMFVKFGWNIGVLFVCGGISCILIVDLVCLNIGFWKFLNRNWFVCKMGKGE